MGPKFPRFLPPPSCASPRPRRHLASILGGRDGDATQTRAAASGAARYSKSWLRAQDGSLCRVFVLSACLFSVCLPLRAHSHAQVCACVFVCVCFVRACVPLCLCAVVSVCVCSRCVCAPLASLFVCSRLFVALFCVSKKRLHVQKTYIRYFQQPHQSAIV